MREESVRADAQVGARDVAAYLCRRARLLLFVARIAFPSVG